MIFTYILYSLCTFFLVEKLVPTTYQYKTTLNEPNQNRMTLFPTNEDEIKSTVKELKINKATGPTGIPVRIPKTNNIELAKPLCDLINLVLQSLTFPGLLKTVIYKKGDPLECNNYRYILLILNKGKLIEKLFHVRLNIVLEMNNASLKMSLNSGSITQLIMH